MSSSAPVLSAMICVAIGCFGQVIAGAADDVKKQIDDAKKRFWLPPAQNVDSPTVGSKVVAAPIPELDGEWWNGVNGQDQQTMTISQKGGEFTADCIYQHPTEGEIRWKLTGAITKDGYISGKLIHVKAPKEWMNQTHIACLASDGRTINGRALFDGGGGHDFVWQNLRNAAVPPGAVNDPRREPDGPWKNSTRAVQVGDLTVFIAAARVGKVALNALGDDANSKEDQLMIQIGIQNSSTSKKHDYHGWATKTFDLEKKYVATAFDEFENQYKRVTFGFASEVVGQIKDGDSLYPNTTLTDVLVFELPIGKATELRFALPAAAIDAEGLLRLRIPITRPNREGFIYNLPDEQKAKHEVESRALAVEKAAKRKLDAAKAAKPDPARDERAADSLFSNAQVLLKMGKLPAYRETLQKIVDKYPQTKAAETARKRLN